MKKTLWAPWRAEYINSAPCKHKTTKPHCLFCRLLKSKRDEANLILHRGRLAFVMMNRFPYNNGHLMVAPLRHEADPVKLSPAEGRELFQSVQKSVGILRDELRPQGFNIGVNLGLPAGAGVAGHLHIHIVPRWSGDVNFMPLLAETKVISEHLAATYGRLRNGFYHQDTKTRPRMRKHE